MARRRRNRGKKKVAKLSKPMKRAVKQIVKRTVQPELKYTDTAIGATTISDLGTIIAITEPTLGTNDFNQRIGDKITLKGFQLKGYVRSNSASASPVQEFRFLIFRWNADSSVDFPTFSKLFASANNPRSLYEHDMRDKFTVLHDDYVLLTPNANSAFQMKKFEIFKKLNSNLMFVGSGTSGKGKLYLAMISFNPVSGPVMQYETRTWYTDA